MSDDNVIGKRWQAQRQRMKKNQTEFAALLGISTSYLSLIESGQRSNPSMKLLRKAAQVTKRSIKYLAGE
jgi:transcriptional regulator with XRE-family HTH domain